MNSQCVVAMMCVLFAGAALAEDDVTPYLTVNDPGNATLYVNGEAASFGEIPYSSTTTLELKPASGYEFLGWNGAVPFGTATNNPLVVKAGKVRSIKPWLRKYYVPATRTSTATADWNNNTWTWPSQIIPGPNDDVVLDGAKLTIDRFVVCKSLTIKNAGMLVIVTDGRPSDISVATGSSPLKGVPSSKLESASLFVKGDLKIEGGSQLAVGAQNWTVNQDYTYAPYGSDVQVGGNVTLTGTGSKMIVCGGPVTNDLTSLTGCGFMTVGGTLSIATNTTLYLASEGYTGGSVLVKANAIELAEGGKIAADARGFSGKKISGMEYVATLAPGLGYSSWKGGGYGGLGYIGSWNASKCPAGYGTTYGNSLVPLLPGSPGGCAGSEYWRYVPVGGGLVRLRANTMTLAGTISANGERTWIARTVSGVEQYGYASSGGGIWLTTSRTMTIAPTAKFLAKGGCANYDGAHGGGGRIALANFIDDETLAYLEKNGEYPATRKVRVRGKSWFQTKNPGVTVDVSPGGGGDAYAGTFTYVDLFRRGFAILFK